MSLLNNGHGFTENRFLQTMRSALPSPPSTPISTDVHRGAGASRPGQETSGRAAGCLHTPALTSQAPGYKVSECKSSSEPRKSPFRDSSVHRYCACPWGSWRLSLVSGSVHASRFDSVRQWFRFPYTRPLPTQSIFQKFWEATLRKSSGWGWPCTQVTSFIKGALSVIKPRV